MADPINPNLEILYAAVHRLGTLAGAMVFLGGCAAGLLLTDSAAAPVRATLDVDAIVEVTSLIDYHKLAEKLRIRGFVEDLGPEAPICRWKAANVILYVMPTDPEIMGFGIYQPMQRFDLFSGSCRIDQFKFAGHQALFTKKCKLRLAFQSQKKRERT